MLHTSFSRSGALCAAALTCFLSFGCGSDNNDDLTFNPGTSIASYSTSTTSSSSGGSSTSNSTSNSTSTGSGSSTSGTSTSTSSVPAQAAPVVTRVDPATVVYVPGTGGSVTTLAVFPNLTVSDSDSANFEGGVLTLTYNSPSTVGASLTPTVNPNTIGTATVTGSTLTVQLSASATPATVQTFLRGLRFQADTSNTDPSQRAAFGSYDVSVTLSDGDGGTSAPVSRTANVQGQNAATFVVGTGPGEFQTINAAITAVNDDLPTDTDRRGSTIRVSSTYVASNEAVAVGPDIPQQGADSDLAGLHLVGLDAGQSIGATPATRSNQGTVVASITLDAAGVSVDGFIVTNPTAGAGYRAITLNGGANSAVIRNNLLIGNDDNSATTASDGSAGVFTNTFGDVTSDLTQTPPPTRVLIQNNSFSNFATGVQIQSMDLVGGTGTNVANLRVVGLTIAGNAFRRNTTAVALENVVNVSIVGNGFAQSFGDHLVTSLDLGSPVSFTGNKLDGSGSQTGGAIGTSVSNVEFNSTAVDTTPFAVDATNNFWTDGFDPTGAAASSISFGGTGFTVNSTPQATADPLPGFTP